MSWTDKFDPALLKMVKEVDTQIAPQLAAIDARICLLYTSPSPRDRG